MDVSLISRKKPEKPKSANAITAYGMTTRWWNDKLRERSIIGEDRHGSGGELEITDLNANTWMKAFCRVEFEWSRHGCLIRAPVAAVGRQLHPHLDTGKGPQGGFALRSGLAAWGGVELTTSLNVCPTNSRKRYGNIYFACS